MCQSDFARQIVHAGPACCCTLLHIRWTLRWCSGARQAQRRWTVRKLRAPAMPPAQANKELLAEAESFAATAVPP